MIAVATTFLTVVLQVLVIIALIACAFEYYSLRQMERTQTKSASSGHWNGAARFPTSAHSKIITLYGVDVMDMNRAELIETCRFLVEYPPCTPK